MHRIRLREPWSACLTADSTAVVYSRKFHKPTGVELQSVTLQISLTPEILPPQIQQVASAGSCTELVMVKVNGIELLPRTEATPQPSTSTIAERLIHYPLGRLEPFNLLEIRVALTIPTTGELGSTLDATPIPTFGSFVIESAELQIE
ncbi:MAG: hypothetical protein SFV81_14630 [Pirellulaceae bacterium]|nr:hypothetical protein [Pirellulaceae bacterium]